MSKLCLYCHVPLNFTSSNLCSGMISHHRYHTPISPLIHFYNILELLFGNAPIRLCPRLIRRFKYHAQVKSFYGTQHQELLIVKDHIYYPEIGLVCMIYQRLLYMNLPDSPNIMTLTFLFVI